MRRLTRTFISRQDRSSRRRCSHVGGITRVEEQFRAAADAVGVRVRMSAGTIVPAVAVERHDEIDDRVGRWLLGGPAQVREGLHAGAVAGCLQRHGAAAYVYPEITGYYLHWLAWRASHWGTTPEIERAAQAAQQ
jgi:hypothetical protein